MQLIGSHQGIALATEEVLAMVVATMAMVVEEMRVAATVGAVMEEVIMVVVAMGVEEITQVEVAVAVAMAMAVVQAMQMMVLAVEHMEVVVITPLQAAAAAAMTAFLAQVVKAAFLALDMGLAQEDLVAVAIKSIVAKVMQWGVQPKVLAITILWKVIPGMKTMSRTTTMPKEPEYAHAGVT